MHNLNQMWVFYGGCVAAAMTQKEVLGLYFQGAHGIYYDCGDFSKNGTTMKACISGIEGTSDS